MTSLSAPPCSQGRLRPSPIFCRWDNSSTQGMSHSMVVDMCGFSRTLWSTNFRDQWRPRCCTQLGNRCDRALVPTRPLADIQHHTQQIAHLGMAGRAHVHQPGHQLGACPNRSRQAPLLNIHSETMAKPTWCRAVNRRNRRLPKQKPMDVSRQMASCTLAGPFAARRTLPRYNNIHMFYMRTPRSSEGGTQPRCMPPFGQVELV